MDVLQGLFLKCGRQGAAAEECRGGRERIMEKESLLYDCIIVGAGAAGLMCASSPAWEESAAKGTGAQTISATADSFARPGSFASPDSFAQTDSFARPDSGRLILEGGQKPGVKLLMSGGGHCNITHEGQMREILGAYGAAGKTLRGALYRYGNRHLTSFLEEAGVPLYADETGRVLPVSMKARDVLDAFLAAARKNGFALRTGQRVTAIGKLTEEAVGTSADGAADGAKSQTAAPDGNSAAQWPVYEVQTDKGVYRTRRLVIATGGCSYPATGSDGEMLRILARDLGVEVTELRPGLVPIIPEDYPYADLAGITIPKVRISIHQDGRKSVHREGALLFTHGAFSGPCALDISGHAARGSRIAVNYIFPCTCEDALAAIRAQGIRSGKAAAAAFSLPKRLAALLCERAADSPKRLARLLTEDTFTVAGTGDFKTAMVTKGGVALHGMTPADLQLRAHPGVFVIGEALDADGISGGYNLQLCWSTAQAAAAACAHLPK